MFIEFLGVTFVHKIIQISGVQVYITSSSLYCVLCLLSKVRSLSITIYPSFTHFNLLSILPSDNHHNVVCICKLCVYVYIFFGLIPSAFPLSPPNPLCSDSCQSVPGVSMCLFLLCLLVYFAH